MSAVQLASIFLFELGWRFLFYIHTHTHTHIYIRFYFNNQHNYQTSLSLEGDFSYLQLCLSYLVFKAVSLHFTAAQLPVSVSSSKIFTCKHRMCLCFILCCIWKSTCRMNFQAAYLGPNKSASIYSHFEPSGGCPCS